MFPCYAVFLGPGFSPSFSWVFVVDFCISCFLIWLWKQCYYFYRAFHALQLHLWHHISVFQSDRHRVTIPIAFVIVMSILFCCELKNFKIVVNLDLMFCLNLMENSSVFICSAGCVTRCFTSVTEFRIQNKVCPKVDCKAEVSNKR